MDFKVPDLNTTDGSNDTAVIDAAYTTPAIDTTEYDNETRVKVFDCCWSVSPGVIDCRCGGVLVTQPRQACWTASKRRCGTVNSNYI